MARTRSHTSRFTIVVLFLAIAMLGMAAWFAIARSDGSETPGTPKPAATSADRGLAPDSAEEKLAGVEASRADRSHAASKTPPANSVQETGVASPPDTPGDPGEESSVLALGGHFELHDGGSISTPALHGSVNVSVRTGNRGQNVTVPVEEGHFELRLLRRADGVYTTTDGRNELGTSAESIAFTVAAPTAEVGGPLVLFDPATNSTVERAPRIPFGTLDIAVYVAKGATLELIVLDRMTQQPLSGVDVYDSTSGIPMGTIDPRGMSLSALTRGAASPVVLAPGGRLSTLSNASITVGARNHAWQSMTVDFTNSHQRTIELEPAGRLKLRLQGSVPDGAILRLRTKGRVYAEERSPTTPCEYDGLGEGDYTASVEIGKSFDSPLVLATAEFSVQAGAEADVTLNIAQLGTIFRAGLAGTVLVDKAWALEDPFLKLQQLTPSKRGGRFRDNLALTPVDSTTGTSDVYAFEARDVETGSYSLTLDALNFVVTLELPPEGLLDVRLDIPPPVDVIVKVMDSVSGAPVPEIAYVLWHPTRPTGVDGGRSERTERDLDSGQFLLRVPACEVSVRAGGDDYSGESMSFMARDGLEVVATVTAHPSAIIELRDGERVIPWPAGMSHTVVDANGEVLPIWTTFRSDGASWFKVVEPGLYTVEIPHIVGYLAHPPVPVQMTVGARETVVVHLIPG